jgi:hypothetical protein
MASIPERQYADIIQDLEELEKYLRRLGLRRGPDRLQILQAKLREIEQARVQNRSASLNTRSDIVDLVWSVVEGQEFADIYKGINGYDEQTVKVLMQKAFNGPLNPSLETKNTNEGRNTVFELRLGANLRRAGACVKLGEQADLLIDYAGAHVYIECKRPLHQHKVRRRVTEARKQLQERFKTDPHHLVVGLVAISVSRTVNPGSKMFIVDEAEALHELEGEISRLHHQYSADYNQLVDPRLLGIVYHLFTPAYVKKNQLLTSASQVAIFLAPWSMQAMFPVSEGKHLKELLLKAFHFTSEGKAADSA